MVWTPKYQLTTRGTNSNFGGLPATWAGPSSGLVYRYQLDQGTIQGSLVLDQADSNNGTTSGSGVTSVPSPPGSFASTGAAFDGSTGYISLANKMSFAIGGGFSIGMWVNFTDITAQSHDAGGTAIRVLYLLDSGGVPFQIVLGNTVMGDLANGIFHVDINDGGSGATDWVTNSAVFVNSKWQHVVWTYSGSGNGHTLYAAGNLAASATTANAQSVSGTASDICGRANGGRLGAFSAYQVCIYNQVLTATQVAQLFNAG